MSVIKPIKSKIDVAVRAALAARPAVAALPHVYMQLLALMWHAAASLINIKRKRPSKR